ncbi:MAG: hypothetical protein AAGG50_13470 [Bacteroidota bacterium]
MFDTVKLALPIDDLEQAKGRLSNVKAHVDGEKVTFTGKMGPLRVKVSQSRFVVEGSLPTYCGKLTLSLEEMRACIARLSDAFGLDLASAKVWRLDTYADFVLSRPVADYLAHFLDGPRYCRVSYERTGKRYVLKWRHLVFYDKVAELKQKRGLVPAAWVDRHVLRFEMQMRSRPNRQLKLKVITFADLADPAFRAHVAARWQREYEGVEKKRTYVESVSVETLKRDLHVAGLRAVGLDAVETILASAQRRGAVSRDKRYRLRRWARATYNLDTRTALAPPIEELDSAVREQHGRICAAKN